MGPVTTVTSSLHSPKSGAITAEDSSMKDSSINSHKRELNYLCYCSFVISAFGKHKHGKNMKYILFYSFLALSHCYMHVTVWEGAARSH